MVGCAASGGMEMQVPFDGSDKVGLDGDCDTDDEPRGIGEGKQVGIGPG